MRFESQAFVDRETWEPVNHYTDRLGRRWLATGKWSLFRVPLHVDTSTAESLEDLK